MPESIGIGDVAALAARSLASSAEAIAAVADLTARLTETDIAIVSEVTADGRYAFRGLVATMPVPVSPDDAIPYPWSLCSRIHTGESPATVPDTREVPALWSQWQRLKEGLGVDWDVLAFCTRDIRLPDGSLYGTLCLHDRQPRSFSPDVQALLEVLARLLGQEIWRERAARDLTVAIDRLEQAERLRVELAEELRHELRAPLQVIDGYAEGMLDGVVQRDDGHVALVRGEAARALRLLDDVLELTRIEIGEGAGDDDVDTVQLDEVAAAMRERLLPLAAAAGIELSADMLPGRVRASRRRLEQLAVNLLRNAIRAVEHGGGSRVVVYVRPADGVVELGVEDDGQGIPDQERDRVFERFYRGASERDARSGSGLGLTISRRIVEDAGGTIRAEAAEPRGTRIVAVLPAAGEGVPSSEQA